MKLGTWALAGLAAVSFFAVAPVPDAAQAMESSAENGAATFNACVAGSGEGDVLVLLDETGSLKASDPTNARVTAATHFAERLAESVSQSGAKINLEVASFGAVMTPVYEWTSFTESELPAVRASIASFVDRTSGYETDYWTALNSARDSLAQRASESKNSASCQAVIWFTDGEYTVFERTTDEDKKLHGATKPYASDVPLVSKDAIKKARELGQKDLCRPGGIIDQVRSSNIWLYGVGLGSEVGDAVDLSFMESIVTGSADGSADCGEVAPQGGQLFFPVTDIDGLLFAFDELASDAPLVSEGAICQDVTCSELPHKVVLDPSLNNIRVLASSEVDGLPMLVESPDAMVTKIVPGAIGEISTVQLDGATVTVETKTDKSVELNLVALQDASQKDAWTGLWRFAFVDESAGSEGKTSRANIHVRSPLEPAWFDRETSELRSGETAELDLGIADRVGGSSERFDAASLLGKVEYVATLVTNEGDRQELLRTTDAETLAKPVSVDLSQTPLGTGTLNLEMTLTTATAKDADGKAIEGTQLSPSTVTIPVNVLPPLDYPVLSGRLDFGVIEGATSASTQIAIAGEGCAWIEPGTDAKIAASPEEIGRVSITIPGASSEQKCVAAGADGVLEFAFETEAQGNGAVNGSVAVQLASATGEGDTLVVEIPFTASLQKPVNAMNFWAALIAALLLGPGIPVALLYGAKAIVARIPRKPFVAARIPVTVNSMSVQRAGAPFSIELTDLRDIVVLDSPRKFTAQGVEFGVRMGASPFGNADVRVTSTEPATAAPGGAGHPGTDKTGRRAVLPLAVQNSWVAMLSATGQEEILLLVSAGADASVLRKIEEEIRSGAASVFDRLHANSGDSSGAQPAAATSAFAPPAAAGAQPAWPGAPTAGSAWPGQSTPATGQPTFQPPQQQSAFQPPTQQQPAQQPQMPQAPATQPQPPVQPPQAPAAGGWPTMPGNPPWQAPPQS